MLHIIRVLLNRHPPPARDASRGSARHGAGFWLVAAAFLMALAFSTVPTPLYSLYRRKDGFSTFIVTVVFAVYAVGVVISLLLAGHISDWVGRKKVLLPAIGIEIVAAVLFLVWPALPGLLAARLVTGLGVGLITATATAYLHELHSAHRPQRRSRPLRTGVGGGQHRRPRRRHAGRGNPGPVGRRSAAHAVPGVRGAAWRSRAAAVALDPGDGRHAARCGPPTGRSGSA